MSQSKRQSFPQDMDGNNPARRSRLYQQTPKTYLNEKFRNSFLKNQHDATGLSDRKSPGSFAKTYVKKTSRLSKTLQKPSGNKYSKKEKLKLIKEFESTGAPIALFSKWYGIGMNTFRQRIHLDITTWMLYV